MNDRDNDQDFFWQNISELPYFRGFLRSIEGKYFREISIKDRVLDLGCGDGHFSARTFKENHLVGIDPSFKSLLSAKEFKFFCGLVCARGDHLPFNSGAFASVISNSVLEHIPDVDAVILEISRLLGRKGQFIISVPNSNFTANLSIAKFFDRLGLNACGNLYRYFFNWISRHYHPDPENQWISRIKDGGFYISNYWNYFPPESLLILEWGHYLGLYSLFNKLFFGKWILFPKKSNPLLKYIYNLLKPSYVKEQKASDGAYTFIVSEKQ